MLCTTERQPSKSSMVSGANISFLAFSQCETHTVHKLNRWSWKIRDFHSRGTKEVAISWNFCVVLGFSLCYLTTIWYFPIQKRNIFLLFWKALMVDKHGRLRQMSTAYFFSGHHQNQNNFTKKSRIFRFQFMFTTDKTYLTISKALEWFRIHKIP